MGSLTLSFWGGLRLSSGMRSTPMASNFVRPSMRFSTLTRNRNMAFPSRMVRTCASSEFSGRAVSLSLDVAAVSSFICVWRARFCFSTSTKVVMTSERFRKENKDKIIVQEIVLVRRRNAQKGKRKEKKHLRRLQNYTLMPKRDRVTLMHTQMLDITVLD